MRKILKTIIAYVLIIVLGLGVGCIIVRNGIFGYRVVRVVSNSMQPYIQKGDYILCKDVKSTDDILIGEVYGYDVGDRIILHRAYRVEDGFYIFKGDNNVHEDLNAVQFGDIKFKFICVLFNIDLEE